MKWTSTKEKLHPDKPGLRDYELLECLVIPKRGHIQMCCWNCEHEVWDDAEGDDCLYGADQIEWWMVIEGPGEQS